MSEKIRNKRSDSLMAASIKITMLLKDNPRIFSAIEIKKELKITDHSWYGGKRISLEGKDIVQFRLKNNLRYAHVDHAEKLGVPKQNPANKSGQSFHEKYADYILFKSKKLRSENTIRWFKHKAAA